MFTKENAKKYGRQGGTARAKRISRKRAREIARHGGIARQLRARIARELSEKPTATQVGVQPIAERTQSL